MSVNRHDPTRRRLLAGGASALALGALASTSTTTAAQLDRDLLDLLYVQEQALIDLYTGMRDAFDEAAFREVGLPDGIRSTIEELLAAEETHQAVVTRPERPHAASSQAILPDDPVAALRLAADLENLAVAAYAFVIPELGRQRLIPELLGILSVEARHAAWLATLLGEDPFPVAIDAPLSLEDSDPAADVATASPEPAANGETAADLAPIVAAIAEELGVSPDEITVASATAEVWPDASLGCPQPDTLYAQVLTPGRRVVVNVGSEQVEFHTDERGAVVRCP